MLGIKGYSISEQLYLGTRFIVYRAQRESEPKHVVLKVCRSDHPTLNDLAILQHEYQLLCSINSPKVVSAYDLIKYQHQLILILEDFGGTSLHLYQEGKPLPLDDFFTIALQVIDSLSILHQLKIIHKDINPHNIIIHPSSLFTKVADFSISSQLTETASGYTPLDHLEGTLAYLSPEQTGRMNCPVDYRTDFYSLGATFFEMLTGHPPFQGHDPVEWIHLHLAKAPPLVSNKNPKVPQQIALIIAKLLAKSPEERYVSAAGLKTDLLRCQTEWLAKQRIDNFSLGKYDISHQLTIPRKLYGRQPQVQDLLNAFNKITQGDTELFLISGYSGIGKSSLVNEIHKPIVQRLGYYSSGKFEQFHHDVPYAALVQAFSKLIKQILSEPEQRLEIWREKLSKILGANGQVIIQVFPEVELLIGKQPSVPELPPPQARNRFETVFCDFVKCFASVDHPLVLFLDDLQWADMASLDLLLLLLRNAKIHYFMLIGAYRDNEVSLDHPLLDVVAELKKNNISVNLIQLKPLDQQSIGSLIADTLNLTQLTGDATALAALILEKTAGNPFFVNTFLTTLYQDKLLYFNNELGRWEWNLKNIGQLGITNNVVDLLITKIERLPQTAQSALKIAACLGNQFDLMTLARIENKSQSALSQALWPALEQNLLIPGDGYKLVMAANDFEQSGQIVSYKFAHDRVQQAAYSMMNESEKKQTHLQLGRIILQHSASEQLADNVFDIINHFNYSVELIIEPPEQLQVASLNVIAGKKAKASAAYAPAMGYFKHAIALVDDKVWSTHYELAFTMHVEHAECQHLLGRYDEADPAFAAIVKKAKNNIDKAHISMQQVLSYTIQVKFDEAIAAGMQGLNVLGMEIPRNPSILRVTLELLKTLWALRGKTADDILKLPTINNAEKILLMDLAERVAIASYLAAPNFLAILGLKSIRYCVRHGNTASVAPMYLLYSFMQIVGFRNIPYANQLAELALRLVEKYDDKRVQAICYFATATIPFHWKKPYAQLLPLLLKSYNLCRQIGDLIYTNYNISIIPLVMLFKGDILTEVETKVRSMKVIADFTRNIDGLSNLTAFIDVLSILKGETSSDRLDQLVHDFTTGVIQHSVPVAYANTGTLILMTCCVMESWNNARVMFHNIKKFHNLQALDPVFFNTEYSFYMGITALNLYKNKGNTFWENREFKKWINKALKRFIIWAKYCPQNYQAKYFTLLAATYSLDGKLQAAMSYYSKAILSARENGLIHIEGIIFQQMASYHLLQNDQLLQSKHYLDEEMYAYTHWGAIAKCKYLEQSYPEWLSRTTTSIVPDRHSTVTTEMPLASINILSIFKFTQTISSEIQLDKLLQKLLNVLLQAAGAQRGVLIAKNENSWYIEAEGTANKEQVYLTPEIDLLSHQELPQQLIQYVLRTQELFVLPGSQHISMDDTYLATVNPKSLLIMPILYQGELKTILYLENRDTSSAFSAEHIQTLKLLASQAAISLENARLYYQATHDPLTGLANRNLLYQLFNFMTHRAIRNKTQIAVLFLDLDSFKRINDTLGHEIGDKLLQYFAQQLKQCLRESDLAVRLGGDEFVVILDGYTDINQITALIDRLLENLAKPALIMQHKILIASSIGISLFPEHGEDIQTLLKNADIALYRVKAHDKGHYQFYIP